MMSGLSEANGQRSRQLQHELKDINRRIDNLERQARSAEDRAETIKRHQLNFALRPNYGGGAAKHGAKTLGGLALMQRMKSQEERNAEDLHNRRTNLERHALEKQNELERQRELEREQAEKRRQREAEARREQRERGETHGRSNPQREPRGTANTRSSQERRRTGGNRGTGRNRGQGRDSGRDADHDRDPL